MNKFKKTIGIIANIMFFLASLILIFRGIIKYDTILNSEFVFGTLWLLYLVITMEINSLKKKIRKLEEE